MNELDKDRFQIAISTMAEAFSKECPGSLQRAYWLVLSDLTIDQFESACFMAMRRLKWFPKPAELLEITTGTPADRAETAWHQFGKAITSEGAYRTVKFADGVLTATIESCGGWEYACNLPVGEFESFYRRRFFDTYLSFMARGISSDRALIGITDRVNQRLGNGGPKLIGDYAQHIASRVSNGIPNKGK